jgi:hypothetical protein
MTNTEREIIILLSVLTAWGLVYKYIGMYAVSYTTCTQVGKLRNKTRQYGTSIYRSHRRYWRDFIREVYRSSGEFNMLSLIHF